MQKKVIEIKLNEYAPIKESIWVISNDQDQVYESKFHGKPVNIFPLKNSNREKIIEKSKMKKILLSTKTPATKIASPKKSDKNKGMTIIEIGIKPLNISSCVNDIEIQ